MRDFALTNVSQNPQVGLNNWELSSITNNPTNESSGCATPGVINLSAFQEYNRIYNEMISLAASLCHFMSFFLKSTPFCVTMVNKAWKIIFVQEVTKGADGLVYVITCHHNITRRQAYGFIFYRQWSPQVSAIFHVRYSRKLKLRHEPYNGIHVVKSSALWLTLQCTFIFK